MIGWVRGLGVVPAPRAAHHRSDPAPGGVGSGRCCGCRAFCVGGCCCGLWLSVVVMVGWDRGLSVVLVVWSGAVVGCSGWLLWLGG